ncbi:glutamine amidotransferase-related protein [Francisella adeliensis]|uniref:Glutamine amidotransferase n=1 Tax=Francisella adeliensis TaxID=2007306 RepID=A0A2Z4XWY9_9GAMM|nr:homoserine O-succinyltransferase [Francisella adeliensis]AXA33210.1 glutamine amidotransferase [Francisella adeliensis]MBK2085070.1 homoserine O-succinyltransferase [Francisella adeliensis]MBK2096939.1 homoserine O-succinyltransferase [Francisella adeliensis]QIW11438.1 type 1 glutamine amidotransferase [Francisella adeliensis]QIW13313.1 type 1 glutamine amidotransferase [Francisella adeliensis]
MKIAILQTDHIPKHRRGVAGGNYPEMFANLFFRLSLIIDFDTYDVTEGQYPKDYSIYDGFIITGSKATAFDNLPWIEKLKSVITEIYKNGQKIVGICFGHQILAQALGGAVKRSEKGFAVGVRNVEVTATKPWMEPYHHYLSLLFYHQDMVIGLPEKAELIATSDYCQVQMFCVNNQIFGIQAHPEMLKVHNHALIKEYQDDIKNEFQHALESLRIRDNSLVIGHWMANFFEYKE